MKETLAIPFDGISHHVSRSEGFYAFMKNYSEYNMFSVSTSTSRMYVQKSTSACIAAQKCSPHIGNALLIDPHFCSCANRLQNLGLNVLVMCDLRDEAKGEHAGD